MRFPIRLVESGPAGGAILAAGIAAESELPARAVVRHGRHHRQDLPDRRRPAADLAQLRGRPRLPLPQGQRPAGAHPGDRDGRDRRRRRLDRHASTSSSASRSARRAPAPSRAPPATAAAAPRRPSPTPIWCWAASIRDALPAAASRSTSTPPSGALERDVGERRSDLRRSHCRLWRRRDRRREHGQRRARARHRARQDPGRPHADRLRRRRAAACGAARREARHGRIVVPTGAGVGSAVGFLRAPVAYEVVRSRYHPPERLRLGRPSTRCCARCRTRPRRSWRPARRARADRRAPPRRDALRRPGPRDRRRPAAARPSRPDDAPILRELFEKRYAELFGRAMPGVEVEILTLVDHHERLGRPARSAIAPTPAQSRRCRDRPAPAVRSGLLGEYKDVAVHWRDELAPGSRIAGPAVIAEDADHDRRVRRASTPASIASAISYWSAAA